MSTGLPWPVAYTVSGGDCASPMPLGHSAPLAEAVRDLAELGYDGVEVQVRETGAHDAETLARTVGAAGLKVLGIGTGPVAAQDRLTLTDPSPDVRRHALARLLGAARLAGELGVPVSLGQTRGTFLPGLEDMQQVWAELAVRHLAEEAATRGSRLLLEPQSRANTSLWHTPAEALAFLDSLDAPAGLVLDTHHLDAEGMDAVRAVTDHTGVTGCLQLAAASTRGPLTVGDPRLPALFTALRTGGFTGWLTLEHTQDGDSTKAAARSWTALTDAAPALS
ncbi:sugar phosphate isomerase/epimerase [Streptomyces sp. Babs14]|uniref:sugar phosphate isomerase/epimerase family protein n=1 Tax=unclassified Streptomyces TaxID=2593676 RepID=UPI001C250785|nr:MULTISPECIES: sugar phosphate isomerase/epimerase family protein [unclassified Streptomyces]MBU8548194.1 sugar phosphate isomerase/epimerase [Streptomyces sp. Osf17]MBU8554968.1 sugar phosphate isomerase/epimerase [Streptomyces sp. Babs14]